MDGETTTSDRERDGAERESLTLLVSSAAGVSAVPLSSGREYILGRSAEGGILIDDASISRRHAVLSTKNELTIEDLGSTNGTRIRGTRLRPGQRVQVDVGVVIELGNATLLIQRSPGIIAAAGGDSATRRPPPQADLVPLANAPIVRALMMVRLYEMLDIIAPSGLNVVILGETGVGKEIFAEAVHRRSTRADKPFLRLNCAALPESVLEGELFGYEKGAFTGAVQARPGLFESADGGTVFLDEIGEMPLSTQAKILRLLESGEVLRLGSRQPTIVDVRFVGATHRDLRFLIAGGSFRSDLYFRLNGISVVVPPLRERTEEIRELALRFLAVSSAKANRRAPTLSDEGQRLLERYAWPGNVRELRNIMERALAFSRSQELTARDLLAAAPELETGEQTIGGVTPTTTASMRPLEATSVFPRVESQPTLPRMVTAPPSAGNDLRSQRESFEKERILAALANTAGNQKRAAEILGVSRRTLVTKLDQYGIERPRKALK